MDIKNLRHKPTDLLCIIDMQICFIAANDPGLIANIQKTINEFNYQRQPIYLLEFEDKYMIQFFATLDDILYSCPDAKRLRKSTNSGHKQIIRMLNKQKLMKVIKNIYIVGVNASACVRDTAESLAKLLPNKTITVIEDCCSDCNLVTSFNRDNSYDPFGWCRNPSFGNLRLIPNIVCTNFR